MPVRYDALLTIVRLQKYFFLSWSVPVDKLTNRIIYLSFRHRNIGFCQEQEIGFVNLHADPVWHLLVFVTIAWAQRDFSHSLENVHLKLAGRKFGPIIFLKTSIGLEIIFLIIIPGFNQNIMIEQAFYSCLQNW